MRARDRARWEQGRSRKSEEASSRGRFAMRRALGLEPVDAHAVCPSGTVVLALLALGWPLSEVAEWVGLDVAVLRATVRPRRRAYQPGRERLGDGALARLVALVGVVVARGWQGAAEGHCRGRARGGA